MRILVIILSIMIFMKTFTYGLYELKDCKNKKSAITLFVFAFSSLILPNLVVFIRGV
ncbi:unknown [Clostridium sp. CAG:452]|jgi:K+-sensing histidine kinase KdpD|nr:unknown [Clostridium sp. CAG:452]